MENSEIIKESNSNKAVKAAVWYTISNIAVRAISLITTPIYTRVMGVGDYGMASTFVSWASIFMIICTLNLGYSIGRAKLDFPGQLDKYIGTMQTFSASVVAVLTIFALVFIDAVSEWLELDKPLVFILLVYLLFMSAVQFAQSKYRFQYKYKENILITVFTTLATFGFTLALLPVFKKYMYYGKVLGTVIPTVIVGAIIWIQAIRTGSASLNKEYLKYGLSISIPLIGHTISLNLLAQSDRLLITKFCGTEATGIYSIAYTYALMIGLITDSVNNAYNPWFHDNYFAKNYDGIKKSVKPLVLLGCMVGIGCISIAPEAIFILGGEPYMDGVWCVIPMALGVIVQYIYSQYVIIEMHLKKTIYVSIGTGIAAVVNIVLNIIFIPVYGFIAAAYTTLISYLVLLVIHYYVVRFRLKIHLYKDRFMFACIFVLVALSVIIGCLYDNVFLRYGVLVICIIMYLVTNKDYVLQTVKKFLKQNRR